MVADEIISDNGTQLKSKQLTEMLQSMGIRHCFTPVCTPQCNPVERTNRLIKTMVSQFINRSQRRWDKRIPALQFRYNTARHEATGYSPAYLNHERELARPNAEDRPQRTTAVVPHVLQKKLEDAFELVQMHFARTFHRQAQHYNLRQRDWRPKIKEQVWKRVHPLSKKADGFNAKFAPQYIRPLIVKRYILSVIADLQDRQNDWHWHVQDSKKVLPTETNDTDSDDNEPENQTAEIGKIQISAESHFVINNMKGIKG
ncbi:uncharacterized protein LOC109861141 [Pseudomyrmex gracilis]|uniref:uncharacterized protein LOC109861141 n=1 Tax=Pseudomyrmex gracilis TaxID=219809 RepID=UPI000995B34F|nr:uncharacterized protein LOC109861141 [Pseudomyrmex gracilis]